MSAQLKDGGPAFPIGSGDMRDPQGMSLRDYFAAHAPEQVDNSSTPEWVAARTGQTIPTIQGDKLAWRTFWVTGEAIMRYQYADAMIAAREVPQ